MGLLTVPFLSRFALKTPQPGEHGFWEAIARAVTRLPVVSILAIAVPMIVLTVFYFDIDTGLNDVNTFPDHAKTKQAFTLLEEEFSIGDVSPAGALSPAEIVIVGDIDSSRSSGGDRPT